MPAIPVQRITCSMRKAGPLLTRRIAQPLLASTVRRPDVATAAALRSISVSAAGQEEKSAGIVKWFSVTKGYGFITPTDGSSDIFVHQTNILTEGFRSLAEGESVEFDLSNDANGRVRAVNVTGPDGANPVGSPRQQQPFNRRDEPWDVRGGGGY